MTVQELFSQLSFESIAKALRNTHRHDESIGNLASYKEAFDILCNIKPDGGGGKVTFNVTPREHWFDEGTLPLLADGVEGDFWENIVGKEVVKPANNPFTDAELASAILWGTTFYGFTPHREWNSEEEVHTKYGKRAQQLERRLYLPYLRDKKAIAKLKDLSLPMPLSFVYFSGAWDLIHCCPKHQNRQKRKRYFRLEKRIEWLMKLDKRHHLIDIIRALTEAPHDALEERIVNAAAIYETQFESHTYGKGSRTEYITDLIGNYAPDSCTGFCADDEIFVITYTAQDQPLAGSELSILKEFFTSFFHTAQWHFLQDFDQYIGGELSVQVIRICRH